MGGCKPGIERGTVPECEHPRKLLKIITLVEARHGRRSQSGTGRHLGRGGSGSWFTVKPLLRQGLEKLFEFGTRRVLEENKTQNQKMGIGERGTKKWIWPVRKLPADSCPLRPAYSVPPGKGL